MSYTHVAVVNVGDSKFSTALQGFLYNIITQYIITIIFIFSNSIFYTLYLIFSDDEHIISYWSTRIVFYKNTCTELILRMILVNMIYDKNDDQYDRHSLTKCTTTFVCIKYGLKICVDVPKIVNKWIRIS